MRMLDELMEDLKSLDLPQDIAESAAKIKCELIPGKRIYWFFKEDEDYCKEFCDGESPREHPVYSGIVVPAPDCEMRGGSLEWEDCVVVHDIYPVEKCYCEVVYIALPRLLDAEGLVEIFAKSAAR